MNIEGELISFLNSHLEDNDIKTRNIEIFTYYYGFRGASWPTLEETANQFSGIKTKESISDLIILFRDIADLLYFPEAERILGVIKSKRFWPQSELEKRIFELEAAQDRFSIRGLFNLMEDLGIVHGYEIYTPDLAKVTRSSIDKYEQYFIIKDNDINKFKSFYKKARGLPGRCGISNLKYLESENKDFGIYNSLLCDMIKASENAWTKTEGDNFWYLFENKDNTLINYCEKTFSVIDNCEINRLAETFENALNYRHHKYPYPSKELISSYLKSSLYLENNQDVLTFTGETTKLNKIEEDMVYYLKSNGIVNYTEISSYLASKKHKKSYIDKTINNSPLVYIDKSKGRKHHEYCLVGNLKGFSLKDNTLNDRYRQFLIRMRKISEKGTDKTVKQKKRQEQAILQQWLFENKNQENCAICGKKYMVSSLVAAHKKKRADCNEAERLDPYIVMPVCVFGCDHLYENKHIYIEYGVIKAGLPINYECQEQKVIEMLIGRKVDKEWLNGQDAYFEAPSKNIQPTQ